MTNSSDVTSDYFSEFLRSKGLPFRRLNTDQVPGSYAPHVELAAAGTTASPFDDLDLRSVRAIWWRRPVPPMLPPQAPAEYRAFLTRETEGAIGGMLRTFEGTWVDHPDSVAAAQSKIQQLHRARSLGWTIPRTIVTSAPERARRFVDQCNGDVIIKPITYGWLEDLSGREHVIYTRSLTADDLVNIGEIGSSPVLLQERLVKQQEYRVTVVEKRVLATTIVATGHRPPPIDWRVLPDDALDYAAVTLPQDVAESCRSIVSAFGLHFGALDVIKDARGEFVFLELNPNGQWAWIEMRTAQPIRAALAEFLYEGTT